MLCKLFGFCHTIFRYKCCSHLIKVPVASGESTEGESEHFCIETWLSYGCVFRLASANIVLVLAMQHSNKGMTHLAICGAGDNGLVSGLWQCLSLKYIVTMA